MNALAELRSPCVSCGGQKEPGKGRRLCEACRTAGRSAPKSRMPGRCGRCGGPKPSGRGRRYCDECRGFASDDAYERLKQRATIRNRARPELRREYQRRYREANRERIEAYNREWTRRNRQRVRTRQKAWNLYQDYGLTLDEFWALHGRQSGGCAICRDEPDDPFSLHVDHCHETGEIRGLLCNNCNTGLGMLGDSLERLKCAVRYLDGS